MKYSWIIFDADGTLFDYNAAERGALTRAFAEFSIVINEDIIRQYRIINDSFFKKFESGEISLDQLRTGRFALLFHNLGLDFDAEIFSGIYLGYLATGSRLLPNVESVVRMLSKRVDLVILTNGISAVQRRRFDRSPIRRYFEDIVISEEEGFPKPSREIFEITFKRMGYPPKEQVLIVGDSLTSDITGGNNYGIDTCWITPDAESMNKSSATYTICQIAELLPVLEIT